MEPVLGKDRVSSAYLPGELQEGFPEEVTFELSLTRQVRVFKTSKSFSAKPGWKLISGRRHNVTCSLAVKGQFVLGIEEKFSMARTWPVSPQRSRRSRGNFEPGTKGLCCAKCGY